MRASNWVARCAGWLILVVGLATLLMGGPARAQAPPPVTGVVVGDEGERPVSGATVRLRGVDPSTVLRTTRTDRDGTFRFAEVRPGRYTMEVQVLGHEMHQRAMIIEGGEPRNVTVQMKRAEASLETVVASPLRRPDRVRDVPASVSVLGPEWIRREGGTSSVEALRSAVGIDVAQTGVDRRLLSLRGFGGPFSGTPYALVEGRPAAAPLLGTNAFGAVPTPTIDMRRVEVTRGPGTPLYGPESSGGVVHLASRDPFQEPGTSVSVGGGSRSFVDAQFRQAGVIGGAVGYKFTGQYGQANEWGLDPDDSKDAAEIRRYYTYDPNEAIPAGRPTVDRQLRREDQYRTYNASGLLRYRMGTETTLSLRGGYASLTSPLQTGLGTLQADALHYGYGQLRLERGTFEAQVGINRNLPRGDTYLLRTGESVVQEGTKWTGAVQYGGRTDVLETRFLVGGDWEVTRPGGASSTLAQQWGDDGMGRYGTFVQATSRLTPRLSATLGTRLDYNDGVEEASMAPRAALTVAVAPKHTLRASYTGAVSYPGTDPLFDADRFSVDPTVRTTGRTVEVGYKGAVADDVQLTVDAYYEEKADVLTPRTVFSPVRTAPHTILFPELEYGVADRIRYGGLDASLRAQLAGRTTAVANVSAVTDDTFGEGAARVALNAPAVKATGGLDVGVTPGLSVGATAQYVEGFPVRWGPYVGAVAPYTRLDLRAEYAVPQVPGLRVDVSAKNVLGPPHREFVGAPELGRMVVGRLTYDLP